MIYRVTSSNGIPTLDLIACDQCKVRPALIVAYDEGSAFSQIRWYCRNCYRAKDAQVQPGAEQRKLGKDFQEKWQGKLRRRLEMQKLVDSGATLQSVGVHFGLTRERVRQIVGNVRPVLAAKKLTLLAEKREMITALWSTGKSHREISQKTGVCVTWIKEMGLPPKPRKSIPHGTPNGYNRGCHCQECRAANAERARKRNHDLRDRGRCVQCGEPSPSTWRCGKCTALFHKQQQAKHASPDSGL